MYEYVGDSLKRRAGDVVNCAPTGIYRTSDVVRHAARADAKPPPFARSSERAARCLLQQADISTTGCINFHRILGEPRISQHPTVSCGMSRCLFGSFVAADNGHDTDDTTGHSGSEKPSSMHI